MSSMQFTLLFWNCSCGTDIKIDIEINGIELRAHPFVVNCCLEVKRKIPRKFNLMGGKIVFSTNDWHNYISTYKRMNLNP